MRSVNLCLGLFACFLLVGCGMEDQRGSTEESSSSKEAMEPASEMMFDAGKLEIDESIPTREVKNGAAPIDEVLVHAESDRDAKDKIELGGGNRPVSKRQIQSGTLTAGSLDDHARFDEYVNYISNVLQRDQSRRWREFMIGQRVQIRIKNEQGQGIGATHLTIEPLDPQHTKTGREIKLLVGTNGNTAFYPDLYSKESGTRFRVTVKTSDGKQSEPQVYSLEETPWIVSMNKQDQVLPNRLDLALVVDTTGSMGDELEYLKVEIDSIDAAINKRFPNVDQRYALILYRDEGDQYVSRTFDFTSSLKEFRQTLASQRANGGGDYPEAVHVALEQSGELSWRRGNAARVMFLVGDAPPHARFYARTAQAVKRLRQSGVSIYPVAASGIKDQAEFILRHAAVLTGGKYLFLTDHSGVGNPHAKPHTPQYSVERLVDLMIRMVASELAGRELLPQDIIATEQGEPIESSPTENEQTQSSIDHHAPTTQVVAGITDPGESMSTVLRWFGFIVILAAYLFLDSRF